jgi:UDPglucose 6-dehydrogenase
MNTIGIIGTGFVGTAVLEGMRHAFEIWAYDKFKGVHGIMGGKPFAISITGPEDGFSQITRKTDVIFVCVPTPMKEDGSCDTSIVEGVVAELSKAVTRQTTVVIKSTVPPGTTARINDMYANLHVCFNPEFLTERNAINDFKNQDRIIIGGPHDGTAILKQIYETAYPNVQVTKTSSTIAEMVKYTTNCFLAAKVAIANEIEQVCSKLEIDYDKVVEYAVKDKRLGMSHWSVPGPDGKKGFGGKCFCKDLNAFISLAESLDAEPLTFKAVWQSNLKVRPERDWEKISGVVSKNE